MFTKTGYEYIPQFKNAHVKNMNVENLISRELAPKSKEVIGECIVYLSNQEVLKDIHKHVSHYDNVALKSWRVDLSARGLIFSKLFSKVNDLRNRKLFLKNAIEDLIAEEIIYPDTLKVGDDEHAKMYIINPTYYYEGSKFLNVYMYWCYKTNTAINEKYLKNCIKENGKTKTPNLSEVALLIARGITEY
jgi:hypothetical protein